MTEEGGRAAPALRVLRKLHVLRPGEGGGHPLLGCVGVELRARAKRGGFCSPQQALLLES